MQGSDTSYSSKSSVEEGSQGVALGLVSYVSLKDVSIQRKLPKLRKKVLGNVAGRESTVTSVDSKSSRAFIGKRTK